MAICLSLKELSFSGHNRRSALISYLLLAAFSSTSFSKWAKSHLIRITIQTRVSVSSFSWGLSSKKIFDKLSTLSSEQADSNSTFGLRLHRVIALSKTTKVMYRVSFQNIISFLKIISSNRTTVN